MEFCYIYDLSMCVYIRSDSTCSFGLPASHHSQLLQGDMEDDMELETVQKSAGVTVEQ